MDHITLRGIEVWAHHGVLPEERATGQPFLVHVAVELDLTRAGDTDDLGDTVDYAGLAAQVATAAGDPPADLIESVAARVAAVVLEHELVEAVTVTIDKPEAPLGVPAAGVSVTIRRTRT